MTTYAVGRATITMRAAPKPPTTGQYALRETFAPWFSSAPGGSFLGAYQVSGTTTLNGAAFAALVLLYPQQAPSVCVASMYSGDSGTFAFYNLAPGNYIVICIDLTGTFDAQVYDFVAAVQ